MDRYIELYGEGEYEETPTTTVRKEKEKAIDLEKYPTMEMREKKTRYKLTLD